VTPRGRLHAFLVERFGQGSQLKVFVDTNFPECSADIGWSSGINAQANELLVSLRSHGSFARLWDALKAARPAFEAAIAQLETTWRDRPDRIELPDPARTVRLLPVVLGSLGLVGCAGIAYTTPRPSPFQWIIFLLLAAGSLSLIIGGITLAAMALRRLTNGGSPVVMILLAVAGVYSPHWGGGGGPPPPDALHPPVGIDAPSIDAPPIDAPPIDASIDAPSVRRLARCRPELRESPFAGKRVVKVACRCRDDRLTGEADVGTYEIGAPVPTSDVKDATTELESQCAP
jgi:hypothetical protein